MAIIDDTGIQSTSLNEYKTLLGQQFQDALSANLDLDPQTLQGQIIGIVAAGLSQIDDAVVQAFQSLNIFAASGQQLDGYGAGFNILRDQATFSTVIAQVGGVPGTILPEGSIAKTTNNDLFHTTGEVAIGITGTADVQFEAAVSGAIAIDANTLIKIVSVVDGWETVDNASAGTLGTTIQTDTAYRIDYFNRLARYAVSTTAAIRSNLLTLPGVLAALVDENDTDNTVVKQNLTLLPHSIAAVVNGGESQAIGDNLYLKKTTGANTEGGNTSIQTAVTVETNGGLLTTTIYYYPVDFVTLLIQITITQYLVVPDVIDQIKEAIIAYFNGTFVSDNPESSSGINIAEPSYLSRLYTPVNSIGGFEVLSLTQEILGSGTPLNVITPDLNQQLVVDATNIVVTIV